MQFFSLVVVRRCYCIIKKSEKEKKQPKPTDKCTLPIHICDDKDEINDFYEQIRRNIEKIIIIIERNGVN